MRITGGEILYLISIFLGILIFTFFMAIHIIIWRVKRPEKHITLPILVFAIIPFVLFLLTLFLNLKFRYLNTEDIVLTWVMYFALGLGYLMTYPAVQAISPSLEMLLYIAKSPEGLTEEELVERFNIKNLVEDRLSDLEEENLAYEKEGQMILTSKGNMLASFMMIQRKIYGLETGEG